MSGHSKWSTIKRDKGINDAKRGQTFTKYANAIAIAARQGGGNPDANFKLRLAVEAARSINMPKDNIERAINRGTGEGGQSAALEEVVYEGFAPYGVALLIEAVTDNRQRTGGMIRALLDKAGGSLAGPGATSFQFKKQAEVVISLEGKDADEVSLQVIDMGAEDVETQGHLLRVLTAVDQLETVKNKLTEAGFNIDRAELTMIPNTTVDLKEKIEVEKVLGVIDKLEELDDVQKVYANFDASEELLKDN